MEGQSIRDSLACYVSSVDLKSRDTLKVGDTWRVNGDGRDGVVTASDSME